MGIDRREEAFTNRVGFRASVEQHLRHLLHRAQGDRLERHSIEGGVQLVGPDNDLESSPRFASGIGVESHAAELIGPIAWRRLARSARNCVSNRAGFTDVRLAGGMPPVMAFASARSVYVRL